MLPPMNSVQEFDQDNLSYHLIPGKTKHSGKKLELYDAAFQMWQTTWNEESKDLKTDHCWNADTFMRQDLIAVLTYNDSPIGVHLYSLVDISYEVTRSHSYFGLFEEEFLEKLKAEKTSILMSMEALAVDSEFQAHKQGVSIGQLLISLGMKVFERTQAQVAVGIARRDRKVNEMAYSLGFSCGGENVDADGIACDYVTLSKPISSEAEDSPLVRHLWENLHDYGCFLNSTFGQEGYAMKQINTKGSSTDNLEMVYKDVLEPLAADFIACPWKERKFYAAWLSQTYYFVSHSTSILASAAARIKEPDIKQRFFKHISEESGHEELAELDVQALGLQLSGFPEMTVTEAFYQSQFYKIEHQDPLISLGYILCLEGLAVEAGSKVLEQLKAHYSEEIKHLFLTVHADEDQEHLKEAFSQIRKLGSEQQEMVLHNLEFTAKLYSMILEQCKQKSILV